MSRTLIIYMSKTGFTKKYAQWIAEEIHSDLCQAGGGPDSVVSLCDYKDRKKINLSDYDTVIYGGGLHAGTINGVKWFKERLPEMEGKTCVVFVTGAASADMPETEKALAHNFTEEERKRLKIFYFQSGLCYEKMGAGDKLMMTVFRSMLKKTQPDSEMCRMVQQSFDLAKKEDVKPLVNYIGSLSYC